jgi:hypothetical protein
VEKHALSMEEMEDIVDLTALVTSVMLLKDTLMLIAKILLLKKVLL